MRKSAIIFILGIATLIAGSCSGRVTKNQTVETNEENEVSNDSVMLQIPSDTVEKEFQKNTVWICEDTTTSAFKMFHPNTLVDFNYDPFDVDESYKINDLKLLFGYYIPSNNGELSLYDSETDYGRRLICFNKNNQIIFKSRGEADSWLFSPNFFISGDKKQIIILCQLGCEEFWGATVFLIEKDEIYYIGHLDIEPYSEEDYNSIPVTSVTNIKRINNTLEFTFSEKSIENIKYIYTAGKLKKK